MKDDPLTAYGAHFYQGIGDGVSSLAELASRALEFASLDERKALRPYLNDALENLTASELKGKLNRAIREYRFTSKGAKALLEATLDQITTDK